MKSIEITVAPDGKTKVETKGFSGNSCQVASRFLETALGARTSEVLTNEFYAQSSQNENQTQQEK